MSPSSFTLAAVFLEAIVFLYNRQVVAMLSMHPSCSGRSSAIGNKLKMSGGGIDFKQLTPGNVSFPVACLNHPKNLKAVNGKARKITKALPMNSETLKNDKVDLNQKLKEIDTGNGVALERYLNSIPFDTKVDGSGKNEFNEVTNPSQEKIKNDKEVILNQKESVKDMSKGEALERYLNNVPSDSKVIENEINKINGKVSKLTQEKLKNDQEFGLNQQGKEIDMSKGEALEYYLNSIPFETKFNESGKNYINEKVTKNIKKESNPMFYSQAGALAKKIKEYIKNTDEFQNQTGMLRRVINRNYTFDSEKDDSVNLIHISNLLMSLNENERDSPENLKNASDLFMALHECYQVNSVIPLVFDVEMVLKKLEEEGNKVNPIKLLEYFRENAIKYPLLDLLKIKDPKDNFDEKIENFKNIIHKSDNFLDKNMIVFVENDNEMFLDEIDSRIETADFVLASIEKILKIFNNFKDFKLSENYAGLKHLKPIEKHDLLENSELLQKLHEKILPGDEMMKF